MRTRFLQIAALLILSVALAGLVWAPAWWIYLFLVPVVGLGLYDSLQTRHAIQRNFPVVGHFRYLLESIGPELHQYFIENATDGTPIDRTKRTYVYSRAKLEHQVHPFGTELDLTEVGYAFMAHSMFPVAHLHPPPRIRIGGPHCTQPYEASVFNIAAMSFGSLSKPAVEALNRGAQAGGFFHCTGEGGISPWHLMGGDLCFQIGTGYFGARTPEGAFSPERFRENALRPEVKLIELKLSQGAKPGHGGILPAAKNNLEVSKIRGVSPNIRIDSPPHHSAFEGGEGLLRFVHQLRELADGKPVGFKLCIGERREFEALCVLMAETGLTPDFIAVDGAEGGTGAAPIDFSNHVGLPLEEGLTFVADMLHKHGLKDQIRIIAAGKVITAFDIYRTLCIGADICYSARGMMLALGCIQALECHRNTCPTGITTDKPGLTRGLVVADKWVRVRNYHHETVEDFLELVAAAGITDLAQLDRTRIWKRMSPEEIRRYDEIHPMGGNGISAPARMG
jgi:glutamate synthase domain-containing protein 2